MPLTGDQRRFVERHLAAGGVSEEGNGGADAISGAPVRYTKARLAWDQTRKMVHSELKEFEALLLKEVSQFPFADEVAQNTHRLYGILDGLDERLMDVLDDALNSVDEASRQKHVSRAKDVLRDYEDFVSSNSLLGALGDNPFRPLSLKPELERVLADLRLHLT